MFSAYSYLSKEREKRETQEDQHGKNDPPTAEQSPEEFRETFLQDIKKLVKSKKTTTVYETKF